MTLSTDIYVQGDVPARDVFEFVLAQLLEFDEAMRPRDEVIEHTGPKSFGSRLGQGLPAILSVYHEPNGECRTVEQAAEHDEEICNLPTSSWVDQDSVMCDGSSHEPACHIEVNLDTAYGFRGPNGMRCSDLHAVMIVRLGRWLAERSVPYAWRNEYTGEIHQGDDGIEELLSAGVDADRWFDNTAMPAIRRAIEAEGGESR